MSGRRPIRGVQAIALAAVALVLIGAGCGEEESTSFSDSKIISTLNLKKSEGGYAIDGDPFCEVDKKLLTDTDAVQQAIDRDKLGLVIHSREGNVGVSGVPPFAPDCQQQAKKKLNKLDPEPKQEQ